MFSGKSKLFVLLLLLLSVVNPIEAQNRIENDEKARALELGIGLLERYFEKDDAWKVTDTETGESVRGLMRFIEKKPLDSILNVLNGSLGDSTFRYVYRLPEYVPDSLEVPGYYPVVSVHRDLEKLARHLRKKYFEDELSVPVSLISDLEGKAGVIKPGEGRKLLEAGIYELPDSLQLPDIIPDSMMHSSYDFRRFLRLDSIRNSFIEEKRMAYNDSIMNAYRDSVIDNYRRQRYEWEYESRRQHLIDSVEFNNYQILKNYNDSVVRAVNDSISFVVEELAEYADFIDTTRVTITNLVGDESSILLQKNNTYYSRLWLKNEQNDSLRMMVKNTGKRSMQMLIDDGVTFSRFKPRETKDFDFSSLNRGVTGLTGVSQKYQAYVPWRIGGDGSVGFTQTYLENWKKGGQSALSLQIILKGYVNYSRHDGKVKWENSGEIRNGYIRPGGDNPEWQKNDDKFEITSRFGVSAFKKWFYGAEFNFETQFFNGYKYPKSTNPDPISAFMAPSRTFFKVGLDYKPNNNFSLFLSPLTAKNVFVKDTVKVDQTKFGIDAGKRGSWEPGLNTDIKYKTQITPDITYETKYKMFINYKGFDNLDINWENLMVMRLTDHINMRMLVHLIYDSKVLFPVVDANNQPTGEEKPKLQVREFISIGFSYKINRNITRARRKN
ncbi:DUF3078 domain-containing protein [Mariniphaga sediminis]|jgi:hypothetical protein|uniref:DUF3078 domain-containing protein n=1 Tax=Mariniphaga sediminis TaxID=1628158 RepID=UPI0035616069